MLIEMEEQMIHLESHDFTIVFDIDYTNEGFFIDIYDKNKQQYLKNNHEIRNHRHKVLLLNKINRPTGTLLKTNNQKFIVKYNSMNSWCADDLGRAIMSYNTDTYDKRHTEPSIPNKINTFLKKTWLKI